MSTVVTAPASLPARLRTATVAAVTVLLIVGASAVGLHDWADAQLTGTSSSSLP